MNPRLNSAIDLLTVEIERCDDPRLRTAREQVLDAAGVAVKPRRRAAIVRLAILALERCKVGTRLNRTQSNPKTLLDGKESLTGAYAPVPAGEETFKMFSPVRKWSARDCFEHTRELFPAHPLHARAETIAHLAGLDLTNVVPDERVGKNQTWVLLKAGER